MDFDRQGSVVMTRWGAASDIGPVRTLNEDSWLAAPPLYAVADGMGGHAGGERASRTALQVMRDRLNAEAMGGRAPTLEDLDRSLGEAAIEVAALAPSLDPVLAPGTTMTGALALLGDPEPYWLVFNVGDSRAYLVGADGAKPVTKDHSALQEAKDYAEATGVQVMMPPSNVVTRALGACMPGIPQADYYRTPLMPGDHLVISTDGMHGAVSEEQIAQVVHSASDPQAIANELVRLALSQGTRDNATVVVVRADHVVGHDPDQDLGVMNRPILSVSPIPTVTAPRTRSLGGE